MTNWLIPCRPDIYDAESAFDEYGHVIWHQQCNIKPGDVAYIYVSSPVQEIRCKCVVDSVNIPCDIGEDDGYVIDEAFCSKAYARYMDLRLIERYESPMLSYRMLLMKGLGGPVRSQRHCPPELDEYLKEITPELKDH